MNRTIDYKLEVDASDPNAVADELIRRCPVEYNTTGVSVDRAFIRYRTTDDAEALRIAKKMASEFFSWNLSTGYGVHRREVRP